MLRTIDFPCLPVNAEEEGFDSGADLIHPVIRREAIVQAKSAQGLLDRANQHADAMFERARQHAQEYREAGFRAGVQTGVDAALDPMVKLLAQLNALKQALHDEAARTLKASMQSLLRQAPMLEALVDSVLEAHMPASSAVVWIRVPAQTDFQTLIARGTAAGLTLRVTQSTRQDEFSISWDGHVWEANLDEICGPFGVGSAELDSLLVSASVREACRDALLAKSKALMI